MPLGSSHAQALRAAKVDGRIIALAGWGQDAHREQSRQAGFDGHLTKPVELACLLSMIAGPT